MSSMLQAAPRAETVVSSLSEARATSLDPAVREAQPEELQRKLLGACCLSAAPAVRAAAAGRRGRRPPAAAITVACIVVGELPESIRFSGGGAAAGDRSALQRKETNKDEGRRPWGQSPPWIPEVSHPLAPPTLPVDFDGDDRRSAIGRIIKEEVASVYSPEGRLRGSGEGSERKGGTEDKGAAPVQCTVGQIRPTARRGTRPRIRHRPSDRQHQRGT